MLQPSVSVSVENANIACLPKNAGPNQSKRLKGRSKALSDVKNTLHSHSSKVIEKTKNNGKNIKNNDGLTSVEKSKKRHGSKAGFSIFETEKDAESKFLSGFECNNHFACEKANALSETDCLSEYKLTKKEIDYFGDKMKFCRLDLQPIKVNFAEPQEDLQIIDSKRHWFDDDIEDDTMIFEIPEPSFL